MPSSSTMIRTQTTANDLVQAQAAVTQAQASLTKLRQGGTPADITQSQAQLTQAQANFDKLTAPVSAAPTWLRQKRRWRRPKFSWIQLAGA